MKLIEFRGSGRAILRLIQHLQGSIKGLSKVAGGRWATPEASTCHELDQDRIGTGKQYAGSQFDLNGSVHDAVCRYDVEINKGGRAAILVGWNRSIGSAGAIGLESPVGESSSLNLTESSWIR